MRCYGCAGFARNAAFIEFFRNCHSRLITLKSDKKTLGQYSYGFFQPHTYVQIFTMCYGV